MKQRGLFWIPVLLAVVLLLPGCGAQANGTRIVSATLVDAVTINDVSYKFEGMDIVKIVLDFNFDEKLSADLDPSGDADTYRNALYTRLIQGAHLLEEGQDIEVLYGYWPKEAGSNYAKEMTLFYVVSQDRKEKGLQFTYDGSAVGDDALTMDTTINPQE